ncbi:probable galacturonosyltransferase 6 [Nymphaea colorata]|nr:probable galacturonosyltransferase 6 [Nymphaea colorata]
MSQPGGDTSRIGITRRRIGFPSPPSSSPPPSTERPPIHGDIDPPPKARLCLTICAFFAILFLVSLQFMQPTHYRNPSDPLRRWIPFDARGKMEHPDNLKQPSSTSVLDMHIVSWIDCLDLRPLVVLINSTISSSRMMENLYFHFFIPDKEEEKPTYYKLKLLFPHSDIEILGHKEVIEKLGTTTTDAKGSWTSLHEIAPFVIPKVYPHLKRFMYVPGDVIIKGSVEELLGIDLTKHAIAAIEECSITLSSLVNFEVLEAMQRLAEKPWVSSLPYEKNACVLNTGVLLINSDGLENDILESILWWDKVFSNRKSRIEHTNPAISVAFYDKYVKLPDVWKIEDLEKSNAAKILRFDGLKKECTGHDRDDQAIQFSGFGSIWKQYFPPSADRILDY